MEMENRMLLISMLGKMCTKICPKYMRHKQNLITPFNNTYNYYCQRGKAKGRAIALLYRQMFVLTTTATHTRTAPYTTRTGTYDKARKNNKKQTSESTSKPLSFDTDSYYITVDNGASYTVTNDLKDFIETPR